MATTTKIKTKEGIIKEYRRYESNAKAALEKAGLDVKTGRYTDAKYVKSASGIMYAGLLVFLDDVFKLKQISIDYGKKDKERKQVQYYIEGLRKRYAKQLDAFNDVYSMLHLSGYYDGVLSSTIIKEGFKLSNEIFNKLSKNL